MGNGEEQGHGLGPSRGRLPCPLREYQHHRSRFLPPPQFPPCLACSDLRGLDRGEDGFGSSAGDAPGLHVDLRNLKQE